MRKRTRTSQRYHQMVDDVPALIPWHGLINECCCCKARHRHDYDVDEKGRLWWTTKRTRRGRLKP